MRINIPASIEDATERLTGIESLLTAQRWERAAIVAAFVRLNDGPGRPPGTSNGVHFSIRDFAELRINGLRSHMTVQTYVNRWLEANEGVYPEPGDAVFLPDDSEWESTRTGTNGHNSTQGMQETITAMTETHGADAVADAITAVAPDAVHGALIRSTPTRPLPEGSTVIPNETGIDAMLDGQSALRNLEAAIIRVKMHRDRNPGVWADFADEWSDRLRRMEAQVGILAAATAGVTDADLEALFENEGSL